LEILGVHVLQTFVNNQVVESVRPLLNAISAYASNGEYAASTNAFSACAFCN
jgi:hypothetical protein